MASELPQFGKNIQKEKNKMSRLKIFYFSINSGRIKLFFVKVEMGEAHIVEKHKWDT